MIYTIILSHINKRQMSHGSKKRKSKSSRSVKSKKKRKLGSIKQYYKLAGGELSGRTLFKFLEASYETHPPRQVISETGVYVLNKKLSSDYVKVYHNKETGFAVIAHRGTLGLSDWVNNTIYGTTGVGWYKTTWRFKHAQEAQKGAELTYGRENLTTIGHSQGGLLAELVGQNGYEVITFNTPAPTKARRETPHQFNIRHPRDPLSVYLVGTQPPMRSQRDIILNAPDDGILQNHSVDMLKFARKERIGRPYPRSRVGSRRPSRRSQHTSPAFAFT